MRKSTDMSTALGIFVTTALVALAIVLGSMSGKSDPMGFINLNAILIVVGGTFFLTMACFTLSEVWHAHILVMRTIFYNAEAPSRSALIALEVADIARKRGILGLQKSVDLSKLNVLYRKGLMLIIDGISLEDTETILYNEIAQHWRDTKKGHPSFVKPQKSRLPWGLLAP